MGKEQESRSTGEGKKTPNPALSKAMYHRWHSPEWAEWREKRRKLTTGVKHSQARKDAVSAALKGKKKSPEEVQRMKEQRGVEIYALPLVLRKVQTGDIIDATGLKSSQIKKMKWRLKAKGILQASSEDTTALKRGTSNAERRKRTPKEAKINKFVGDLVRERFVTDNLWYWDRLHQMYAYYQRDLPKFIPQQITLEAFFASKLHEARGNNDVPTAFQKIAQDHEMAEGEEENFIKEKISRAVVFRKISQ